MPFRVPLGFPLVRPPSVCFALSSPRFFYSHIALLAGNRRTLVEWSPLCDALVVP